MSGRLVKSELVRISPSPKMDLKGFFAGLFVLRLSNGYQHAEKKVVIY